MGIKKIFSRKARESRKGGYVGGAECGQFALDFYFDEGDVENCKVEIRAGVAMDVVLNASHAAYGFLLSCYNEGAKDAMEAYCGMLWQCSHLLAVDAHFPKRVMQSWQKYARSLEKQAESAAAAVADGQNEADEALMGEAARIGALSEDEKKKLAGDIADRLDALAGGGEAAKP